MITDDRSLDVTANKFPFDVFMFASLTRAPSIQHMSLMIVVFHIKIAIISRISGGICRLRGILFVVPTN